MLALQEADVLAELADFDVAFRDRGVALLDFGITFEENCLQFLCIAR
ncbi:MAG: hypothetical protein GY937_15355, partial [bacterium]|nr:hypothetical protein [bacterium]